MGSGQVIPFNGWGIPVWCLLVICLGTLMILSIKKQKEIESLLNKINNKIKIQQNNRAIKKLAIKEKKNKENKEKINID